MLYDVCLFNNNLIALGFVKAIVKSKVYGYNERGLELVNRKELLQHAGLGAGTK
jgi:hypothetical protein